MAIRGSFGSREKQTEALLSTLLAEMAAAQLVRLQHVEELRRIRQLCEQALDELEQQQQREEQKLDLLQRMLQAIERRSRPRDADDARVLLAVAAAVGSTRFSAREVIH